VSEVDVTAHELTHEEEKNRAQLKARSKTVVNSYFLTASSEKSSLYDIPFPAYSVAKQDIRGDENRLIHVPACCFSMLAKTMVRPGLEVQ
jgi:hypothetical protein